MNSQEVARFLEASSGESRRIEFKDSFKWRSAKDDLHIKIVKTCMAMANLRDGGVIIIGVQENKKEGRFVPTGMTEEQQLSFSQDVVQRFVNTFCSPYVDLTVSRPTLDDQRLIVIQVQEFADIPIVATDGPCELRAGHIYVRTKRMPETRPIQEQSEMREILDLALDKALLRFNRQGALAGLVPQQAGDEFYRRERGDL